VYSTKDPNETREGFVMAEQILNAIRHNPWVLAIGTLAFFSLKGILWLLIPFLVIRWRRLVLKRRP
jgi:hypothetical protein